MTTRDIEHTELDDNLDDTDTKKRTSRKVKRVFVIFLSPPPPPLPQLLSSFSIRPHFISTSCVCASFFPHQKIVVNHAKPNPSRLLLTILAFQDMPVRLSLRITEDHCGGRVAEAARKKIE